VASTPPPEPVGGRLEISSSAAHLLVQLGQSVHYRVEVTNAGDAPLHELFVVDFLPKEVTFVSAPLPDQVEAALYGKVGTQENITWNVGTLRPGRTITLPWSGTAASQGDMTAVNSVRAEAAGVDRARGKSRSFVATTVTAAGANPTPRPTKTTVVTVRRVSSNSVLGAVDASGQVVPATGFDLRGALFAAGLLLLLGSLAWWAASPRSSRRTKVVVALAVAGLLTACTAGRDQASPSSTVSPQVKGKRIDKNGGNAATEPNTQPGSGSDGRQGSQGGDDTSGGTAAPTPPIDSSPSTPAPEPSSVLVTTSQVVTLPVDLRPAIGLASQRGDNAVTYSWDQGSSSIQSASSSTRFGGDGLVRMETSLREGSGGTEAVVSITNTSSDQPVAVGGRISYTLRSSAGEVATLRSERLNVTLNPGGATSALFIYDLPSGSYSATSSFQSD
jgi:uncharacterized repeat protein (TIGR01451 family)